MNENYISDKTKSDLKKLGWYQFVGGIAGILVLAWIIYETQAFSMLLVLILIVLSLFFIFSIFCGWMCLQQKTIALKISLINQLLQLLGFALLGFGFEYVAGVFLSVGFNFDSGDMLFNFGVSKINFFLNRFPAETRLEINLVALFLVIYIRRIMERTENENDLRKAAEIGNKD